jgi:hypothetical protein
VLANFDLEISRFAADFFDVGGGENSMLNAAQPPPV